MGKNVVTALFDYETVKKAVKIHYQSIDFEKLDKLPDSENCRTYLDLFSMMLKKYGVNDDSVMLREAK